MVLSPALLRTLIGLAALWVWLTLALRFYVGAQLALANGDSALGGIVGSLGYFTVLTTVGIALVMSAAFFSDSTSRAMRFFRHPSVISALATSIILVALVYVLVLRQLWNPEGLRYWIDISLHYVIPPMFVGVWWWLVPADSLRWQNILLWVIYPLVYLAVVYLRGAVIDFYPYPFVNVAELGWWRVLLNSFFLLLLFAFIGLVLIAINRYRR